MGDPYLRFPSRNTTPLSPIEFSFTNPSTSQSKQARDRLPLPLDPHNLSSSSIPAQRQSFHTGTANVAVANQPLFKATKPGPLTSAELSSGTNAFKLCANKSQTSFNSTNNALLRQEVFKSAHTLAPTPQPSNKPLPSTSPAAVPLRSSNKPGSKPQLQASAGSVTRSSFLKLEHPPLLGKTNARDTDSEGDYGAGYSDQNILTAPSERRPSATPSSDYQRASDVDLVELTAPVPSLGRPQDKAREPTLPPKTPSRPIEKSQVIVEEKRQQLRDTIAEYQNTCAELEASLRQQQGVSDLLRDELSQVRGNYSESLELNAELRTSLVAMANEHTETSKSLAAFHKQIDDLTSERSDLRVSENSAIEEAKSLKHSLSSLTSENMRIASLLDENETTFAKKLKVLQEQNDTGSRDLKNALTELTQKTESLESLRSAHDEVLVQVEVHRREENEARERISHLVHEVELKNQSLEEARKTNESSAVRLSELERRLSQAGEENGILKGKLAGLEKAHSVSYAYIPPFLVYLT
ncbi:hypothetical protein FS749_010838 [Ceratobasidium sp. UAMH 11750]|nr:hypothetical protein FS749_010838 [Ceratobasidium sp. UAMH 11750]